jgi:hypothetical protein
MWHPVLEGRIERRLLINYRLDPDRAAELVPAPLRPQLVDGFAVAGICLLRLGEMRPRGLPRWLGLQSENAAHRVAVEWNGPDGIHRGVFIPRRDTNALTNVVVGGRVFPGVHEWARFHVDEDAGRFNVSFVSLDGSAAVDARVSVADRLDGSVLFRDLAEASAFLEQGSVGYSSTRSRGYLDGLQLRTRPWSLKPTVIERVQSSLFDDPRRFPRGTAELDCALVMVDVPVEWHPVERMGTGERVEQLARAGLGRHDPLVPRRALDMGGYSSRR